MAFMELMSEKKFFPPASVWKLMPELMGSARKLGWISVEDIGFIAAKAFAEPEQFTGKDLQLAADVQSIDGCRMIYREVFGKNPPRFPMPVWMFERFGFAGQDLTKMWRWLRDGQLPLETSLTRSIHPRALSVHDWLEKQKLQ
jgi:hypothetical protein